MTTTDAAYAHRHGTASRPSENRRTPCPPCLGPPAENPTPGATYVVMGSRLPLRGYRFIPRFLAHSMRIRRQLATADGLIGFALNARLAHKEFWTVSVWDSRDELERFCLRRPPRHHHPHQTGAHGPVQVRVLDLPRARRPRRVGCRSRTARHAGQLSRDRRPRPPGRIWGGLTRYRGVGSAMSRRCPCTFLAHEGLHQGVAQAGRGPLPRKFALIGRSAGHTAAQC